MKQTKPFEAELLETLSHFPAGLAHSELRDLCPGNRPNAVHAALYNLRNGGCVEVAHERPGRAKSTEKVYVATGRSYADRIRLSAVRKLKAPTQAAVDHRLTEALATVAELEAWKAAAILRFPDLAVEQAIIEARKRVAAILREGSDNTGADQVMSGLRDHTPIVKAVAATIRDLA